MTEIDDRIGRANMAGNLALIYSRLGRFEDSAQGEPV